MKILVSDFDKTLFTEDYNENIKAINKFVDDGNIFIIATGRNIYSLNKDLDKNLKYNYLICNDGGVIYDKNQNIIYQKNIDERFIKQIFDKLKQNACVGNPLIDQKTRYIDYVGFPANAIVARMIDKKETSKLLTSLLQNENITGYMSDNWLNITEKTVSKATAIKIISKKLNHNYKNVYAIGDNYNDIQMCQICNGISMKQGVDELKKVCHKTVNSVKEAIENITKRKN